MVAGPAPSSEASVLAALQAGTRSAADAAGFEDSAPRLPGRSATVGRLERARRWLFEQAPDTGAEPTPDDVTDDGAEKALDGVTDDAADDGWTATELAALRADTGPADGQSEAPDGRQFEAPDDAAAGADRTAAARAELARRLAAIHDDPQYDPAAVPGNGAEVRPTVAWADLAASTPAAVDAAEPGPEPTASLEPQPAADPEPEVLAPAQAAGPASEESAPRRPRPRPYAGAPVHYADEPLDTGPELPGARSERNAPTRANETAPAARSRSDEPPRQTPDEGGPTRGRRTVRWLIRTAVLVVIAVVTAVLLRAYVVSPYYIPSASMEPTLHGCSGCNNDHVLVDKLSYRMHDVHRGDVVVFHRPDTWQVPEKTLIKRVIGLPGDRLAVRDGKVYVNGLQLQESYLDANCPPMTSLSEDPGSPVRTYGPVPDGDLYVMGDNRCDSADSRAFGPVPISDVIGRAFVIIWPLGRIHWL